MSILVYHLIQKHHLATLIILYITLVVDSSRDTIVSLGKNDQFNHAIGISGVQAANDFIIGYEGNATNFKIKRDIGRQL